MPKKFGQVPESLRNLEIFLYMLETSGRTLETLSNLEKNLLCNMIEKNYNIFV